MILKLQNLDSHLATLSIDILNDMMFEILVSTEDIYLYKTNQ
jgi:hypothetical protein